MLYSCLYCWTFNFEFRSPTAPEILLSALNRASLYISYFVEQNWLNFNDLVLICHFIFVIAIRGGLAEVLCKPKILPLKSAVLVQLQKIEKEIEVREEGEEPDNFNVRDHKWRNCASNINWFCHSCHRHEGIMSLLGTISVGIWTYCTPEWSVIDEAPFSTYSLLYGCTVRSPVTGVHTV